MCSKQMFPKNAPGNFFAFLWISTSCKKSEKSDEQIQRKMFYIQTDGHGQGRGPKYIRNLTKRFKIRQKHKLILGGNMQCFMKSKNSFGHIKLILVIFHEEQKQLWSY